MPLKPAKSAKKKGGKKKKEKTLAEPKEPKVNALEVVLKQILDRTVQLIRQKDEAMIRATVKIQAAVRSYFVRKRHPECMELFFRRQRRLDDERNHQKRVHAATIIQKHWRGYRARNSYDKALGSIILIQSHMRGFLVRKFVRWYKAARSIQAQVRGFLQRRRYHRLLRFTRETAAATQMQRLARGFVARRKVAAMRKEKREREAATEIQRFIRGFLARRRVSKLRARLLAEKRTKAATDIQRHFRGFVARKRWIPILRQNAAGGVCFTCKKSLTGAFYMCSICLNAFHKFCQKPMIHPFTRERVCPPCGASHAELAALEAGPLQNGVVIAALPTPPLPRASLQPVRSSNSTAPSPAAAASTFTPTAQQGGGKAAASVIPPAPSTHRIRSKAILEPRGPEQEGPATPRMVLQAAAEERRGQPMAQASTAAEAERRGGNGERRRPAEGSLEPTPSTSTAGEREEGSAQGRANEGNGPVAPTLTPSRRALLKPASMGPNGERVLPSKVASFKGTITDLSQPGKVRVLRRVDSKVEAEAVLLQQGPEVETAFGKLPPNAAKRLFLARQFAYLVCQDADQQLKTEQR